MNRPRTVARAKKRPRARYACAHSFARLLGFHADLKPLEETFQEEQRMEEKLAVFSETLALDEVESEQPVERQQKLAA